jgi:1-deoxy-D-xylulose-5-phosphate synthase
VESAEPIILGRGRILRRGERICLVSTGGTMAQVVEAADELRRQDMPVTVAHFHTLTPFDFDTFDAATQNTAVALVVEEHGIRGGLAAGLPAHILETGRSLRVVRLGPDDSRVLGNPTHAELQQRFRYDVPSIVSAAAEWWDHRTPPGAGGSARTTISA